MPRSGELLSYGRPTGFAAHGLPGKLFIVVYGVGAVVTPFSGYLLGQRISPTYAFIGLAAGLLIAAAQILVVRGVIRFNRTAWKIAIALCALAFASAVLRASVDENLWLVWTRWFKAGLALLVLHYFWDRRSDFGIHG